MSILIFQTFAYAEGNHLQNVKSLQHAFIMNSACLNAQLWKIGTLSRVYVSFQRILPVKAAGNIFCRSGQNLLDSCTCNQHSATNIRDRLKNVTTDIRFYKC